MIRRTQPGNSSPERGSDRPFSYITPGHVRAFQMLTSGLFDNVTLCSCTIDGEPGVAIVLVDEMREGQIAVMPLFVAITPAMKLRFHAEDETEGEEGGGPLRSDILREFAANLESLTAGSG